MKNLLLLICISITTVMTANNTPSIPPEQSDLWKCNLPAPMNFQISAIGADWVTFTWGGNAAAQHRIRIYRQSDGALLSTTIIPQGIATATIAIPPNTPFLAEINAICLDGTHSPNISNLFGSGLILDLVVVGFEGTTGGQECSMTGSGNYCTFQGIPFATFKITMNTSTQEDLYPTHFDLVPGSYGEGSPKFILHQEAANSGSNHTFSYYCNASTAPDCNGATYITIKFWESGVATTVAVLQGSINYASNTRINKLTGNLYNHQGTYCKIQMLDYVPGYGSSPAIALDRKDEVYEDNRVATIFPNPFSESFDILLPHPSTEAVNLQLFNLSGQKVLDQQFPAGSDLYTLSTADLIPGFYMLRIEADGKIQTLKVIKAE